MNIVLPCPMRRCAVQPRPAVACMSCLLSDTANHAADGVQVRRKRQGKRPTRCRACGGTCQFAGPRERQLSPRRARVRAMCVPGRPIGSIPQHSAWPQERSRKKKYRRSPSADRLFVQIRNFDPASPLEGYDQDGTTSSTSTKRIGRSEVRPRCTTRACGVIDLASRRQYKDFSWERDMQANLATRRGRER